MHSATTATGRPLPPPGKTLPENRPAPLTSRPVCPQEVHAELTPQKSYPEHTFIQIFRNCLKRNEKGFSNRNKTDVSAKYRFPRTSDGTGKSPAAEESRRQSGDWRSQAMRRRDTGRATQITSHESGVTNLPRRQAGHYSPTCLAGRRVTTHSLSNRHFLQGSASRQRRIADANRPPQIASNIVSNRQWQILEITVNLSKQTIATRSNRHKNALFASRMGQRDALFASPVSGVRWTPPESCHRTRMGSRDAFSNARNLPSQPRALPTYLESLPKAALARKIVLHAILCWP